MIRSISIKNNSGLFSVVATETEGLIEKVVFTYKTFSSIVDARRYIRETKSFLEEEEIPFSYFNYCITLEDK